MTQKVYVGIDPGNNGAFCVLGEDGEIIKTWVMPKIGAKLSFHGIAAWFRDFHKYFCIEKKCEVYVAVEKIFAYSDDYKNSSDFKKKLEGVVSMQNYGKGYGALIGTLCFLELTFVEPSPKTWQKELWIGADPRKKPKEKSFEAFQKRWPTSTKMVMATDRCRKPHDGLVDACLIAEFGRKQKNSLAKS